jgi:hypothetical protein
VQHFKQIMKLVLHWILRKLRELRHDGFRSAARQIVNAQMQRGVLVWNTPLNRHRNVLRLRHHPQKHRAFDRVVVGKRHHARKPERLFDLIALELKGGQCGKWRRPKRLLKIHCDCGLCLSALFLRGQREPQHRVPFGVFLNERQAFF